MCQDATNFTKNTSTAFGYKYYLKLIMQWFHGKGFANLVTTYYLKLIMQCVRMPLTSQKIPALHLIAKYYLKIIMQ